MPLVQHTPLGYFGAVEATIPATIAPTIAPPSHLESRSFWTACSFSSLHHHHLTGSTPLTITSPSAVIMTSPEGTDCRSSIV